MQHIEYTTLLDTGILVRVSCIFCNSGVLQSLNVYDEGTDEKIKNVSKQMLDELEKDAYTVLHHKDLLEINKEHN